MTSIRSFALCAIMGVFLGACATTNPSAKSARGTASEPPTVGASNDQISDRFRLLDLYSMQSGYWSTAKDAQGSSTILRFMAFALKPAANQGDPESYNGRLLIYLQDGNDYEKFNVAVDNEKFMWSGAMAGSEPSLSVNRRGSLLIQTGNDGFGREAWSQTITAAFRGNQIIVAGYDYTSYDKLMEYPAINCSVNVLTGQIVYQETDVKTDKPTHRSAYRNSQIQQTIALRDWNDDLSQKMFDEACKKPARRTKLNLKRNTTK